MSIEPIGLLTVLIGVLCFLQGYRASFIVAVAASVMGASAAMLIGSANIPPAHVLLAFAALSLVWRQDDFVTATRLMKFPHPGFWLLCLLGYGLLTAIFMPRLMAGSTPIIPLGTSEYADTGSTVPLGPVSSNFTQGLYMTADVICFVMTLAVASTPTGFKAVVTALFAYTGANIFFAFLDVATYATGTGWTLEFIRNAKYTLHIEEEVSGLKRIVGSFPEASAFARATLGGLGFTGTLWVCGYRPALTGSLAFASLALVILSTSSTGLAATPPLLAILYATALFRNGFDMRRPWSSALLVAAPAIALAIALAVLLNDAARAAVFDFLDKLIFSKAGTDSGIERASWNRFAMGNFFDSMGVGIGLGTARTSSFPVALLSSVGIPGTLLYLLFIGSAFIPRRGAPRVFTTDVRAAGRNACLGFIIGDCFASPTMEQGILFYVLAALACSVPERRAIRHHAVPHTMAGVRT